MESPRICELPEEERPREKLAAKGTDALTDSELIAILLRTGTVGVSALDLGRHLLKKHKSLRELARCSVEEIAREKGVGKTKAIQLAAAFGLAGRLAREALSRDMITKPEDIYHLLGPEMMVLTRESVRVVLLDTKQHVIRIHEVSLGSLTESIAHPREIFQPVIAYAAHSFVLVHNHPSGDPLPSDQDRRITNRLKEASRLLMVTFYDHVIVGTSDNGRKPYFSFREVNAMD